MSGPEMLPSSLKEKKRYVAFEIMGEGKIEFSDTVNAFWHSLLDTFGEVEVSSINFWLVKDAWSGERQTGIIKCNHSHVAQIRAALALLHRIGDEKVLVRTMGVSGTLKSARKKLLGVKSLESFG